MDNRPRGRLRRIARASGIALAVVVLGLLALEGLLRGLGFYLTRSFDATQRRAVEDRNCVTILTLGESTTRGIWVGRDQSYPRQLERLLTRRYARPICVVTPLHIGQNTSQMYNRIDRYLSAFSPRLVLLMCGVNNTWSLDESNIGAFIDAGEPGARGLLLRITLDHYRVFKLARMAKYDLDSWWGRAESDLSGRPQFTPWPPPDENVRFGSRNLEAFLELWRYEVGAMIDRSRARGATAVLMTYPNYDFPPLSEFEALAARKQVLLVRNDLLFKPFLEPGRAGRYFFEDGRHPRAEGYGIMAGELARLIEERDLLRIR
jgi:lysophospholipase L1-like esterase